ncbi:HAD family hydrolase [Rubrolithibacter danxiaensis]|uniref:HAD family hydrolase n=1 Tax=Rubrolithibacter danxiaensis TaxID=3390805 RepID=UPI003BF88FC6
MIDTIIFDFGGVLIDWNPKYLYKKIFKDEDEMNEFLGTICTPDWNEEQDAGRSLKEATEFLIEKYPDHEINIRAYYDRWEEMLGGVFEGTVEILKKLKESGKYKLYGLTNWSHETFPVAQSRYEFLHWFDGIVVSGTEKSRKPFPEFYQLIIDRYSIVPANSIFIDDNQRNLEGAEKMGINTIHFISSEKLKAALNECGVVI